MSYLMKRTESFRPEMRVCGLICLFALLESIAYGFTFPYFSIHLEKSGADAFVIGLNTSAGLVAVLLFAPLYPRLMVRYGYRDFSLYAFAVAGIGAFALLLSENIYWWCASRFVIGAALAALWVSTESWLNHAVSDAYRGRVNAIFQAIYSFGFFIGPNLTYLTGFSGALPIFALGGLAFAGAASIALLAPTKGGAVDAENHGPVTRKLLSGAKAILVIAVLAGVCETAFYSLLPVYGLQRGMSTDVAVAILVAYTLGEVFVALPIGWMADRVDRGVLLLSCTLLACAAAFFIGQADGDPLVAGAIAFFAGGFVVSLYNIALVQMGERYSGCILPVIGTAFSVAYAVGSATGSSIGGAIMEVTGPLGLPYGVAAILATAAIAQAYLLVMQNRAQVIADPSGQPP